MSRSSQRRNRVVEERNKEIKYQMVDGRWLIILSKPLFHMLVWDLNREIFRIIECKCILSMFLIDYCLDL
jgi:hypothetical protein